MGKFCTFIEHMNVLPWTLFMAKKNSKNIVLLTIPMQEAPFLNIKYHVKAKKMP